MELLKNLEGMSADEQMTAVVELQKAAMKQLEEQKQVSIGKSAEMVIQGLKKIKSDFEAKFDSLNYDIQAKVANLKDGQPGIQGPKGDQGDRGLDGANGRDGRDGKDGRDGVDGVDGIGVRDAKIDFDGSLVISLTDGREINCGEVVSVDVAKQIQKVTHNIQTGAGGDSQTVLDAIAALQATIATYGTMATQNANNVAITGGTINNTVIGGTTPAAGTFTTLTATGQTSLGGVAGAEGLRVVPVASSTRYLTAQGSTADEVYLTASGPSGSNVALALSSRATGAVRFYTNTANQEQMRVAHTASAVNYVQVTGAATGGRPTISAQGSDATAGLNIYAKGGSSIFFSGNANNIAFGISHVSSATNYIAVAPSVAGSAPVLSAQGTDTNISQVFQSKGTGAIDLAAGSSGINISNGGTVTALTRTAGGTGYTSSPTVAISAPTTAGGVQATATVAVSAGAITTFTITNAGSGYVEQPTVSFSGGGGSGASAYATVGSGTTVRGLGGSGNSAQSISFVTPSGESFRVATATTPGTSANFLQAASGATGNGPWLTSQGSDSNVWMTLGTKGTGNIQFVTNLGTEQLRVSHTASAVNYVQVTGSATGGLPVISAQGSDTDVSLRYNSKGSGTHLWYNGSGAAQFRVGAVASSANYLRANAAVASASPALVSEGSDTNIDLALTPKGTGNVRFGTYTANMALTIQGYIEIKDSGGTVRKVAVIA
jgi:hypothetical protein